MVIFAHHKAFIKLIIHYHYHLTIGCTLLDIGLQHRTPVALVRSGLHPLPTRGLRQVIRPSCRTSYAAPIRGPLGSCSCSRIKKSVLRAVWPTQFVELVLGFLVCIRDNSYICYDRARNPVNLDIFKMHKLITGWKLVKLLFSKGDLL